MECTFTIQGIYRIQFSSNNTRIDPPPPISLSLCVFSQPSKRILNQSYWPFSTSSCLNYPSMIPLLRMALNCKTWNIEMNGSMAVHVSRRKRIMWLSGPWQCGYDLVESIAKDAPLTKTQKILYGLFTVGGQYAWTRANRYITSKGWGELDESDVRNKVYRVLQTGEKYWKAFSLINFLVFLWNGKYRTLIDRVLAMRLVYSKKSMNRQVSFEFLNRQMVWHAFTVSCWGWWIYICMSKHIATM